MLILIQIQFQKCMKSHCNVSLFIEYKVLYCTCCYLLENMELKYFSENWNFGCNVHRNGSMIDYGKRVPRLFMVDCLWSSLSSIIVLVVLHQFVYSLFLETVFFSVVSVLTRHFQPIPYLVQIFFWKNQIFTMYPRKIVNFHKHFFWGG